MIALPFLFMNSIRQQNPNDNYDARCHICDAQKLVTKTQHKDYIAKNRLVSGANWGGQLLRLATTHLMGLLRGAGGGNIEQVGMIFPYCSTMAGPHFSSLFGVSDALDVM